MRPYKSFLFLLLLLAALWVFGAADFQLLESPPLKDIGKRIFNSPLPARQEEAPEEDSETLSLQERWAQDELMSMYKRIYRLEPSVFQDTRLSNIPLFPLDFDTGRIGRELLDEFFVKLLILSNPEYEESLRNWYAKPDFWDEPLAGNRKNFVRILHYGDSQIEDDRITSTLRELFQRHFGGHGPGLLPLFQPYRSDSKPAISGAWHTVKADKDARRGNFGVYGAHLTSPPLNTIVAGRNQDKGVISYTVPDGALTGASLLEAVLHADVRETHFSAKADGHPLPISGVLSSFTQQRLDYRLQPGTGKIELEMNLGRKNRTLYALALNDSVGLSVDNLPMRGSAGSVFTPNNRRFLIDQYNLLNVGLIIYQFGANAVKPGKNNDYGYYRMLLMQELSYIRTQMPSVPVIVIGVADKPGANADINRIRQIQKETAFQTGCIYWDFYEAMGGEGSMRRWNEAGLAGKDGVHLSAEGAEAAGKLFYKAFLAAYRDFLSRERKTRMLARAKELRESEGGVR